MAAFELDALDRFPTGTAVSAYPLTGWHPQMLQPGSGPPVVSVETRTMGDHSAIFTNLERGQPYAFAAQINGEWRYVEGGIPVDAVLRGELEVNLADFALGNGSIETDGILAAISEVPEGGTLFIPAGEYLSDEQILISSRINVRGEGIGSVLAFALDTATDGLVIDGPGLLYGLAWKDFAIAGGAGATRNAFVIREVADSTFDEIYVRCGTKTTGDAVSGGSASRAT
jgi:hypothetical protein